MDRQTPVKTLPSLAVGNYAHKMRIVFNHLQTNLREGKAFAPVCLSTGGVMMSLPVMDSTPIQHPPVQYPSPMYSTSPWAPPPPPGQEAGGMHPTGMLSCFFFL